MSLAQQLKMNREESGLTREQLADTLGVPLFLVQYLEEPDAENAELEEVLAQAVDVSVEVFRGEQQRPSKEQVQDEQARFQAIRHYVLDPARCENPEVARELFDNQPLSLPEQNLILYMATLALYNFCTNEYSSFGFDEYLFKLHAPLLKRLEKHCVAEGLADEEREERLATGRANLFSCESPENIAVMVFEDFAQELDQKIESGDLAFEEDAGLPFTWMVDRDVMQIEIHDADGGVRDTIKLLDASRRKRVHEEG